MGTLTDLVSMDDTEQIDDLEHAVCVVCYPAPSMFQKAMCGAPQPMMIVTEHPDFSKPLCAVCVEIVRSLEPCRGCGS